MRQKVPCLLAAMLMAGCATVRAQPPVSGPPPVDASIAEGVPVADGWMSAYVHAVRESSVRARPAPPASQVAERLSKDLAAASSALAAAPTAANEVNLAQAYVRHHITDKALEHFARAAALDPSEGAAWDGLARIWRDWGFPQIGLGDAYRSVYASSGSSAARNTLGTILQSLGKGDEARAQFALAVTLDPNAAYARNNLCYSWLLEANIVTGSAECEKALAIEPSLVSARNNLALARAIDGDLAGAAEIFGVAGGRAVAQYNLGVIYMAQHQYAHAADAFDRASALEPSLTLARARSRQARKYAAELLDDGGPHERR